MTRGQLPQRAGLLGLNSGGAAAVVWHHLRCSQTDELTKPAVHNILYPATLPYSIALARCTLESLTCHRTEAHEKLPSLIANSLLLLSPQSTSATTPLLVYLCEYALMKEF